MAKGRRKIPAGSRTYGFPIYCAAWAPVHAIIAKDPKEGERQTDKEPEPVAVLGGGGGESRSGIPNAVLLSSFDSSARSLSDQPVFRLETDGEVPYRMAVHPGGDGFVCAFPNNCRWFEWNFAESEEVNNLTLQSSEKTLTQLEDVGLQLTLAFNAEGSKLATGGEDGHLRIFNWPSMEIVLDQTDIHTTVKDLDFSSNTKFLASLGNSGPCRIWDLTSSKIAASLTREDGEIFGSCKFSQHTDNNQILYITAMHGEHAKIIAWSTESWKRIATKRIVRDAISAFNVSTDGKFLAVGTVEGDIAILNSSDMRLHAMVRKAHLGIITSLAFSRDSRVLMSASFDSTARVMVVEGKKKNGLSMWLIIFVIFLAILLYFIKFKEVL